METVASSKRPRQGLVLERLGFDFLFRGFRMARVGMAGEIEEKQQMKGSAASDVGISEIGVEPKRNTEKSDEVEAEAGRIR